MEPPQLDILTPLQRQVLDAVFAEEAFARVFYLTGGTALAAFYLFHRYSDDLDFFTNEPQLEVVWPLVQALQPRLGWMVESRTPHHIRLRFAEGLRVDVVQDVPVRFGLPQRHGAWVVDGLENITVNKITAIQGRLEVKDYVDLYVLLKDRPADAIFEGLTKAKQKDTSIDPFVWSRVIGDVDTFRLLPRMIVPVTLDELVAFYRQLRRRLLASLKPT
jgi:hypothetical protein